MQMAMAMATQTHMHMHMHMHMRVRLPRLTPRSFRVLPGHDQSLMGTGHGSREASRGAWTP